MRIPGRPAKPKDVYEVILALYGQRIAVVTVPAKSEEDARLVAGRYLRANIIPVRVDKTDGALPPGGRGIRLAESGDDRAMKPANVKPSWWPEASDA